MTLAFIVQLSHSCHAASLCLNLLHVQAPNSKNTLCREFIDRRLNLRSCMRFLLEGVQYNDEQLQDNCILLFARSKSHQLILMIEHNTHPFLPACLTLTFQTYSSPTAFSTLNLFCTMQTSITHILKQQRAFHQKPSRPFCLTK